MKKNFVGKLTNCAACGRVAHASAGAILARLYPTEFFCCGCGRRTLHCSCVDVASELQKAA